MTPQTNQTPIPLSEERRAPARSTTAVGDAWLVAAVAFAATSVVGLVVALGA